MSEQIVAWDEADKALAAAIFGVHERVEAFALIEEWAQPRFGASTIGFFEMSVGAVVGLRASERDLCLKVWPPTTDANALRAQIKIQAALAAEGFPAPAVIGEVERFGQGHAVVMAFNRSGRPTDVREPGVAKAMAAGLADFVRRARRFSELTGLPSKELPRGLWPKPHNVLFDFEATRQGAEWIDAIAEPALACLRAARSAPVVGHMDWSAKNMRIGNNRIGVVYDWDAVMLAPETIVVGEAAATFPTTWELPVRRIPTPAEMAAFIGAYETARRRQFSDAELDEIAAAATYARAYGARCGHAIDPERNEWKDSPREVLSMLGGNTAMMLRPAR